MSKINPPGEFKNIGQGWFSCVMCGTSFNRVEVLYDAGGVEPTVGETITGATSADTGVLEEHCLYSGTFAAGDAEGVLVLKNYTGDSAGLCFQADEYLNGSTAGSHFATAVAAGAVKKSGFMYPRNRMVRIDGKLYCEKHAAGVTAAESLDASKYVPEEIHSED